jgi:hypothetical protein
VWIDTADLVQAQDLDVFDEDGNAAHEAYLDILEELKAKDTYCGKCVKIFFTTLNKKWLLVYNIVYKTNRSL